MQVFIVADMEGASGIYRRGQCHYGRDLWRKSGREALTNSVNALAEGAFRAGAHTVSYRDIHDTGLNTDLKKLDRRISARLGQFLKPVPIIGRIPASDLVFFLGHAGVTKQNAFIPHTLHGHVTALTVNGIDVCEIELFAAIIGLPFALAVGDAAMTAESKLVMPWLEVVTIDKNPLLLEDEKLRIEVIRREAQQLVAGAVSAVERASEMKRYGFQGPIEICIRIKADSPLQANKYRLPMEDSAYIIQAADYGAAYDALIRFLFFPPAMLRVADLALGFKRWWYKMSA